MTSKQTWFDYWKENMEGLGYKIPASWNGTEEYVLSRITLIAVAAEKFGRSVSVAELVGAGTLTEEFLFLGALGASAFVGAAIGSAAVATGRSISGGTSLADVLAYATIKVSPSTQARQVITTHPVIYQRNNTARRGYAMSSEIRQ